MPGRIGASENTLKGGALFGSFCKISSKREALLPANRVFDCSTTVTRGDIGVSGRFFDGRAVVYTDLHWLSCITSTVSEVSALAVDVPVSPISSSSVSSTLSVKYA